MSTSVVSGPSDFALPQSQVNVVRWNIYFGFAVLAIGVIMGLGQALGYAHVNVVRYYPVVKSYYQGLTIHGVLNALVLTTAFANGFIALTTARGLGRKLNNALLYTAFFTLFIGSILALYAMLAGKASVLYTFYPPLEADWTFYLGLALVVVSTWITSAAQLIALRGWRKDHPGERVPLLAFMSIATYVMWDIASVGLGVEVVVFLLPWSLGLLPGADPMLDRTLFWFTGHPIVYFWLLPIYVSWYGLIPRQAGGVLFSDTLTRVAFLLFILLVPVGFHHQFVDPGISQGLKFTVAAITFAIFFPSLMTAFSVMYALEIAGRRRGGTGLVGWFFKLPWSDPSVAAQVLAMIAFLLGGISGLMNASYTMNMEIHNTAFVPGHFHLTIGCAVALSYMGIAYWLVPYLQRRELWSRRLALFQAFLYFFGVMIFSRGLMAGGLEGMPRRTDMVHATYFLAAWKIPGIMAGVGGSLMFASAMIFFFILVMTMVAGKRTQPVDLPFTATVHAPPTIGWQPRLDRLGYWVLASVILIVAVYGPFVFGHLPPRLTAAGLLYP
jgi:cytochrome c oxidase subunit I